MYLGMYVLPPHRCSFDRSFKITRILRREFDRHTVTIRLTFGTDLTKTPLRHYTHIYIYIMISDTLCRKCMEEILLTFLYNNHSWIFHCIKVMTLGSRYFANRFSIVIFDHYIFLDCIYRVCTYDNLFLVRRVENVLRKFH